MMNPTIDITHAGHPDRRFAHLVFYILRPAKDPAGPLRLDDWLACIDRAPDLVLDEVYPQDNIHRERWETWREVGRARWSGPDGDVHFHFRPAGVGPCGEHLPLDLKTETQLDRLRQALPPDPGLDDWLRIVADSRFMELLQNQGEPRRAWWVGRTGQRKALFCWQPPAVWMYQLPAARLDDPAPRPDAARQARCRQLARELGAVLEAGL